MAWTPLTFLAARGTIEPVGYHKSVVHVGVQTASPEALVLWQEVGLRVVLTVTITAFAIAGGVISGLLDGSVVNNRGEPAQLPRCIELHVQPSYFEVVTAFNKIIYMSTRTPTSISFPMISYTDSCDEVAAQLGPEDGLPVIHDGEDNLLTASAHANGPCFTIVRAFLGWCATCCIHALYTAWPQKGISG